MKVWSPEHTRLTLAEILGEALYDRPSPAPEEIARLATRLHTPTARRYLVDRLTAGDVPDPELVLILFRLLGTGAEEARLLALAVDEARPLPVRAAAFSALPEPIQEEAAHRLGPVGLFDLMEASIREILASGDASADPETADFLAERVRRAPEGPARSQVFERLEGIRREEGVDAAVWEPLLRDPGLAGLREKCLSAIVDEGQPGSVPFLESLRDDPDFRGEHAALQKAILKLRSQPPRPAPAVRGRAYVTGSDGAGAFVVLLVVERPGARADVVDLCLLARGEIRDGFVLSRESAAGVDGIVSRLHDATPGVAEVTLERAAALVRWAARRHPAEIPVPDDARAAMALVDRLDDVPLPPIEPDPSVDEARLRVALDRPEYDSWFFEPADLASVGMRAGRATPRWIGSAARALARAPGFRDRVLWMARFTAQLELARGDRDRAGLFQAAAREVEERFETATLTRILLERSPSDLALEDEPWSLESGFGDPYFRESIRRDVFPDLEAPIGRDLARLDLTEVADVLLEEAFGALPAEKRPGRPARLKVAASIAGLLADLLADGPGDGGALEPGLKRLLGPLALGKKERDTVVEPVLEGLVEFIGTVCDGCPVRCFERPLEPMGVLFFSDEHPSTAKPPTRGRRKR